MTVLKMPLPRRPTETERKILAELTDCRMLCRLDFPKRYFVIADMDTHQRFGIVDTADVVPLWRQGWIKGREDSDSDPRKGADEFLLTEAGDEALQATKALL